MVSLEGRPVSRARRLVWALALLLLVLAVPEAQADDLNEAVALYRAGQLDRALDAFVRLRARGGDDADELATICLHLGILRTGTGDAAAAREAFECLMAVRPAAALPESLGPAVGSVFDEARRAVGDRPLSVVLRAPESTRADRTFEVRAGATGGAAQIVATTRLTLSSDAGRQQFDLTGPGPHRKELRAPSSIFRLQIDESLRDRSGWVLAEASTVVRVISPTPGSGAGPPPAAADEASTPITGRWWFWTGVGAVIAGGVAVALVVASSADGAEVGAPTVVGNL